MAHWRRWFWTIALLTSGALSCGGQSDSDGVGGKAGSGGSAAGGIGGIGASGGSGGSGAASGGTAGSGATGSGATGSGATGSGATGSGATGGVGGAPGPLCSGVPCAAGMECCLADGKCFDPVNDASACTPPTKPGPNGQTPCTASSHCKSNEFCQPASSTLCLGPGYCVEKSNCGSSSGKPMCGCNGVTYPDVQTACLAGVTIIGTGKCGETQVIGAGGGSAGKTVTYCATSSMCPTGQDCCNITGLCYDASQPVLCTFPPPGASATCLDESHCFDGSEYCKKDGCTGPGGCVSIGGSGQCTGEFTPVCGCNGKTYTNAGCAAAEGVNVAHAGQCP